MALDVVLIARVHVNLYIEESRTMWGSLLRGRVPTLGLRYFPGRLPDGLRWGSVVTCITQALAMGTTPYTNGPEMVQCNQGSTAANHQPGDSRVVKVRLVVLR